MTFISQDNRRTHSRRVASIDARLSHESESVEGTVENVGEGGVFFATTNLELSVDEGSPVTISFVCSKDGAPVTIERTGSILRAERYFDGAGVVRAFAIKFDELISLSGLDLE